MLQRRLISCRWFYRFVCRIMRIPCFKCWRTRVPPTWLVICGALLVQVGFGLYPVIVKVFATTTKASPLIFSFYRDLICFPLLFLCALIVDRKVMLPDLKMLVVFILLGLLGMFGNQLLYLLGVYWAGPNVASAFQPIIPVWTTILAIASCTEKFPHPLHVHTWAKLGGILLATGGAVELTLIGSEEKHNSSSTASTNSATLQVFGYVALFGNTFCMAIYVLLQKRFIFNPKSDNIWKKYPVYVTAYSYFFGAVFMGVGSVLYSAATGKWEEFLIPQQSVYALVYAVFIASALCYLLITWTNIHLNATIVTAFWPTQVLIAVVASYFITKDKLAPLQYIGAAMLIVALFLVLFSNYMEGRLESGRSVLLVTCQLTAPTGASLNDDKTSLLPNQQVSHRTYGPPTISDERTQSSVIN